MLWGFKHENRSTIWTYLDSWIIPEVASVFTWTRVVAVKAVTSDVDMWWVRSRKAFLPWWIYSQCLLSNHMCSCSERSCLWEQDKVWIRTCDFTWRRFMDASEVSCRICRVRLNAFLDFFVVRVSSSVWERRSTCLAENLSRTQRFNLSAIIPHLLLQTLWNESIVSISQHLCMKPTACCSILAGRGSLYCIKCWERSVQPRSCRAEVWMSAALVFLWRCSHRYWESSWFSRAAAPH